MILLQKRSTERGVPIELPHHRDSTDRWSTKDNVGKKAMNHQPFGPIDPEARWQLNQPAEKDPNPSKEELNN